MWKFFPKKVIVTDHIEFSNSSHKKSKSMLDRFLTVRLKKWLDTDTTT